MLKKIKTTICIMFAIIIATISPVASYAGVITNNNEITSLLRTRYTIISQNQKEVTFNINNIGKYKNSSAFLTGGSVGAAMSTNSSGGKITYCKIFKVYEGDFKGNKIWKGDKALTGKITKNGKVSVQNCNVSGRVYDFIVRYFDKNNKVIVEDELIIRRLKSPYIKSITSKNGKATLNWKKIPSASGYFISYCKGSKFNNDESVTKKISDGNTISTTISGLKKGETYTFRIFAYGRYKCSSVCFDYLMDDAGISAPFHKTVKIK